MRVRQRDDVRVLEVHGDVDVHGAPVVRDALASAVEDGVGGVVVDLRQTSLLSSAVLATLLNALRRLTRAGRPMVLVGGPQAERVLRLTRLDDTLPLCPDVDAAVRRCRSALAAAA